MSYEKILVQHIENFDEYIKESRTHREEMVQRLSVVETKLEERTEKGVKQKVFDWSGIAALIGVIAQWLN
jgi:hypothetical protein